MDFLFKIITVIIVVLVGYLFIGAVINTMYEAGTMFDSKKKAYEPVKDDDDGYERDAIDDFLDKI